MSVEASPLASSDTSISKSDPPSGVSSSSCSIHEVKPDRDRLHEWRQHIGVRQVEIIVEGFLQHR
jgi:hypothetical protein